MTNAAQLKSNPLPAILVYGTPGGPALTQASWFRAEDTEAVKAAAEALKFSVIELQTDAEKALTVGVHEGVLKGSGRMIVGSVSAEVYRRIEEYRRKGAGAPDPSGPENAATTIKPASEQTMNVGAAASLATPAIDKPDSATARELFGSARGCWPPIGTRSASSRASGSRPSSGSTTASSFSSGSSIRTIRRSRAGPRTSPSHIPSSASRASDARKSVLANSLGRPAGRPSSFSACPEPGARPPKPQHQETEAMTSTTASNSERIRILNDAFLNGRSPFLASGEAPWATAQRRWRSARISSATRALCPRPPTSCKPATRAKLRLKDWAFGAARRRHLAFIALPGAASDGPPPRQNGFQVARWVNFR